MNKRNVLLSLGALACWLVLGTPGTIHAQSTTPPSVSTPEQQGKFDGDYADFGSAALEVAGVEAPESTLEY